MIILYELEDQDSARVWAQNRLNDLYDWHPNMPVVNTLRPEMISHGHFFALREKPLRGKLTDFEVGQGSEQAELIPAIAKLIIDFIKLSPSNICLMSEQRWEKNDKIWKEQISKQLADGVLFCNKSIIYKLDSTNCSEQQTVEILNETFWFNLCYALLSDIDEAISHFMPSSEVPYQNIRDATTHLKCLVLDAYDLEGCIVWADKLFTSNI